MPFQMSLIDNSNQPVIAIDFDDTLCVSKFPDIGEPKLGAREALVRFRELGYLILIYSCRSCHWHYDIYGGHGVPVMERPTVVAMRDWLYLHGIPYDEIDDGSRGKPLGIIIDDKAIEFKNNWAAIAERISALHTTE
jgi:hypothetical protein